MCAEVKHWSLLISKVHNLKKLILRGKSVTIFIGIVDLPSFLTTGLFQYSFS
jgi:hypothetical protein